jgi:NTE family protein
MLAAEPEQAPPQKKRVRVGIAFAGGAALGLAHVGVIKWFEEHRIPIDAVAGTSMGGMVGSLYATGRNTEELEEFLKDVDWNVALSSRPTYRQRSYRRKEDAREYPSFIEMGFKGGHLNLPTGLSAGEGVGLLISSYTAAYSDMRSFDDLPTPFRCVATDLNARDQVIFDKGDLFLAVRSTMSLPALFAPVKDGNRLMVDGGALNNLPVDVVRNRMNVDVVIGVELDKPADPKEKLSLLSIAGKSISTMITDNERRNMPLADLLIWPDLKALSASDYLAWAAFEKSGYDAAEAKSKMLLPYALSEADYREYVRQRLSKRRPDHITPQSIAIKGAELAPKREAALIAALTPETGKTLDQATLEDELTKITGMGRYDVATYQYVKKDGKDELEVDLHEKDYGPPFLKPSFLIGGDNATGLQFGIGARLTFLDAGGPASEWRSDFSVGQINALGTEYYYRIKGGKWFVAPRGYIRRFTLPIYVGTDRIGEYRTTTYGGAADLGYAFGRFQELRVGYAGGMLHTAIPVQSANFTPIDGQASAFTAHWGYFGQDAAVIPRRGIRSEVFGSWNTRFPGMNKQFPLIDGQFSYAHPLTGKFFAVTGFSAGATANNAALGNVFLLGGLYELSALERGQLYGSNYYNGRVYLLRSLSNEQMSMLGRFYATVGYEVGDAWRKGYGSNPYNSAVVGISGETPLGIFFFGGGFGEWGEAKVVFRIGRFF